MFFYFLFLSKQRAAVCFIRVGGLVPSNFGLGHYPVLLRLDHLFLGWATLFLIHLVSILYLCGLDLGQVYYFIFGLELLLLRVYMSKAKKVVSVI